MSAGSAAGDNMKEIALSKGYKAIVDDEDFERLSKYKWHIHLNGKKNLIYASRYGVGNVTIRMHREIMNAPIGVYVDHINHNTLDNRKQNLRLCTKDQNKFNNLRKIGKSGYRGVYYRRGKWEARISIKNRMFAIGSFNTPEDAAKAWDEEAIKIRGAFTKLNFSNEERQEVVV